MKLKLFTFSLLLTGLFYLSGCTDEKEINEIGPTVDTYSADLATSWNDLFLEIDRYAPGYRPPAAARALSYISLGVYEGLVKGMPGYNSVASNFSGLSLPQPEDNKGYQWILVANTIYSDMFLEFFPNITDDLKQKIKNLEKKYVEQYIDQVSSDVTTRSIDYGHKVAAAMMTYAKTDDVGQNAYKNANPASYVPPIGGGLWRPTPPDYTRALMPYFGTVRSWVITEKDTVPAPYAYSADHVSPMYAAAMEVYSVVNEKKYEYQWIGEFWSDDIFGLTFEPAARWVAIASQVINQEKAPLSKALYTYAKVGMTLCDAGILCWKYKYVYNVERPVTYINDHIDPAWRPSLNNPLVSMNGVTPPFPAYPSGHATFGAAAAEVLGNVFSYDYGMTDRCHEYRVEFYGTPRTFDSFDDMAYENALSRIYLGVHYRMDIETGYNIGKSIGRKVNALHWKN